MGWNGSLQRYRHKAFDASLSSGVRNRRASIAGGQKQLFPYCRNPSYLQELQEPELQLEHPEEVCFSTPLMPKVENFFTTFSETHSGHDTVVFPKTSFSNSRPQAEHLYSKMGIFLLRYCCDLSGRDGSPAVHLASIDAYFFIIT